MSDVVLTAQNFDQEVLQANVPVLVDFWAEWCGPCKMVAPVIDEVAKEFDGKVKVAKLNVDDQQDVAAKYAIMSIPTFMVFKAGKVVSQFVGAQPKDRFVEELNKALQQSS